MIKRSFQCVWSRYWVNENNVFFLTKQLSSFFILWFTWKWQFLVPLFYICNIFTWINYPKINEPDELRLFLRNFWKIPMPTCGTLNGQLLGKINNLSDSLCHYENKFSAINKSERKKPFPPNFRSFVLEWDQFCVNFDSVIVRHRSKDFIEQN